MLTRKLFAIWCVLFSAALAVAEEEPSASRAAGTTLQRQLEMELEEIEGATLYEIELRSVVSGKVSTFKMKKPLWRARVRPGKYKMRLRSYDDRGVPGDWSPAQEFIVAFPPPELLKPAAGEQVKTDAEDAAEVDFAWKPVPGASKYRVDVASAPEETFSETVEGTSVKIKLPVARSYSWKVTAIMPTGEDGESTEKPNHFVAVAKRLDAPEIEKPIDKYISKVSWERPARAESFTYSLSRFDTKERKWKNVSKQSGHQLSEVEIPLEEPGGRYRLQVRAEALHREPSYVSKIDFEVYNGDRSPAAIEDARLRDSMEKPTTWYAIASYLITNVQYEGVNAEGAGGAQTVGYSNTGGTGRIGIGYFKPNSPTGYIGILDLSGLNIAGENVTFASLEGHYARRYYWGVNQLRVSGGIFMKELPQSFQLPSKAYEHKKVSYLGPHIGADFWHPFSYKYGIQFNTRFYLSTFTGDTPNGNDVAMTPSYQFGVMGSMRLSRDVIGFAGWAYRQDKVTYKRGPAAPAGINVDNEVSLTGNYLNLLLEYGF